MKKKFDANEMLQSICSNLEDLKNTVKQQAEERGDPIEKFLFIDLGGMGQLVGVSKQGRTWECHGVYLSRVVAEAFAIVEKY